MARVDLAPTAPAEHGGPVEQEEAPVLVAGDQVEVLERSARDGVEQILRGAGGERNPRRQLDRRLLEDAREDLLLRGEVVIDGGQWRIRTDRLAPLLCFTGTLLFLLGLLTGFGIPAFRTPRIGLSAHVAAIESGLALIAFGLMWPHLGLSESWAAPIAHTFWLSLYVLWIGLLLGAVWGTGRSLPIAGAGFTTVAWQETTARALISLGALGSAGAVVALPFQWKWVV